MAIDVSKYPSVIARPYYLATKDTPQRKDYQRFLLENTVSFLAVLSVANLISLYESWNDDDNNKYNDDIQKIRETLKINLERMSLGLWNHTLRETTRILIDYQKDVFSPELLDFYHGPNANKTVDAINKLIEIRNHDAHGNPIAADKLKQELDKRQILLDKVIGEAVFLEKYNLMVMSNFEIKDDKQLYIGKQFIDDGFSTKSIQTTLNVPTDEVILLNEKGSAYILLAPLAFYCLIDDTEIDHVGIFSKFTDRENSSSQYLSLDGHSTINLHQYADENDSSISDKFSILKDIYSDPDNEEVFLPNLDASTKLNQKTIDVCDDGFLEISIINKKSIELSNFALSLEFPDTLGDISWDEEIAADRISFSSETNSALIKISEINNDFSEKFKFHFSPKESGNFTIRTGLASYEYFQKESDRELNKITSDEIEIANLLVEVYDPNSKDKMCPVVNINKKIYGDNADDKSADRIEVGDNFIFDLQLSNIGMGTARKLSLEILFPPEIQLVEGVEKIKININPGESRNFKYHLTTRKAGIYNILVRDLLYHDSLDEKYLTQANDDYRVVVKSNLIKEFGYLLEDSYSDLYISEDEKNKIDTIFLSNDHITEQYYLECDHSALIKVMRTLIKKICKRRDFNIRETVYTENKRQIKYTSTPARTAIVFTHSKIPFFAIDITNKDNIVFWSLPTPLAKQNQAIISHDISYKLKGAYSTGLNGDRGNHKLPEMLQYNIVKHDPDFGIKAFSKWINMALSTLEKEFKPWVKLASMVDKHLNATKVHCRFDQIEILLQSHQVRESLIYSSYKNEHIEIRKYYNSRNLYNIVLRGETVFKKGLIEFLKNGAPSDIQFLTGCTKGTVDGDRIGQFCAKCKKISINPSFDITLKTEDDYQAAINKVDELLQLFRRGAAYGLLRSDDFSNQIGSQVFIDNYPRLLEYGIAFRPSEDMKSIEIYSFKYHASGTATTMDCIGFLDKQYSGWRLNINFYGEPEITEDLSRQITINPSWYHASRNRWLCIDAKTEDDVKNLIDVILLSSHSYASDKNCIWPKFKQKEMLIEYGKRETGFFPLVKEILNGIISYDRILLNFTKQAIEPELDRTLRKMSRYSSLYRRDDVFIDKGRDANREIIIKEQYLQTLMEMRDENPEMNFLEAGDIANIRKYLGILKLAHPTLSDITVGNSYIDNFRAGTFNISGLQGSIGIHIKKKDISAWIRTLKIPGKEMESLSSFYQELLNDCQNEFSTQLLFPGIKIMGKESDSLYLSGVIDHQEFELFNSEEKLLQLKEVFVELFAFFEMKIQAL
ncbi:hypothetical protein KAJ27_08115 [bacterium]|nr:hypothetical protein [bacterium]